MAPQQQAADPDAKLKALFTKLEAALKAQGGSLKKTLKLIDSSGRQTLAYMSINAAGSACRCGAHSNGVITSCAVLVLAPGDTDALKSRAVVLIQYDEFQQALDAIAASDAVADDLLFEKVCDHVTCRESAYAVLGCAARSLLDCQRLKCKLPGCRYYSHIRYALPDDWEACHHICAGLLLLPAGKAGTGAVGGTAGGRLHRCGCAMCDACHMRHWTISGGMYSCPGN
jgi:hypothetical protein